MEIRTEFIEITTKGRNDIIDITGRVEAILNSSGLAEGNISLFAVGSTTGITTVEYEPGLVKTDLPALFEKMAPYGPHYAHHDTWHDDNGSSHLNAALLGPSLSVPFLDGKPLLGTWQQIVLIDFDTRARSRRVVVQLTGKP